MTILKSCYKCTYGFVICHETLTEPILNVNKLNVQSVPNGSDKAKPATEKREAMGTVRHIAVCCTSHLPLTGSHRLVHRDVTHTPNLETDRFFQQYLLENDG